MPARVAACPAEYKAATELNQDLPEGWDEERIRKIIEYYDNQTEDEAIAEDEAAWNREGYTWIQVPHALVAEVIKIVEEFEARSQNE